MSKPVSAADCITAAARKHKLTEELRKLMNCIYELSNSRTYEIRK